MTNTTYSHADSPQEHDTHDGSADLFEAALAVLRSAGVGFDVIGDFRRVDSGPETFDRAA